MRRLYFPLIMLLILCLMGVGAVSAQWMFAEGFDPGYGMAPRFGITEWLYSSEEVLPDEIVMGESHIDLLLGILGESPQVNKNHSINGKDAIERAVKNQGIVYSFEKISGSNLKHVFTTQASRELDFVMQYEEETGNILLFTYREDDLAAAHLGVSYVEVFMTVLSDESGEWHDVGSMVGHSVVTLYPGSSSRRVVNPENFIPGPKPQ